MSRCVACLFYDRQSARAADERGLQWGLCRRDAPRLHPLNGKTHAVEGVWPTVRDDDWCGEWRAQGQPVIADLVGRPASSPAVPPLPAAPAVVRAMPVQGGAAAIAAGYKPTPGKPAR